LGGATIGRTIFTCVYIEKEMFCRTTRPISIKLGTKSSLGNGNLLIVQRNGQILFKGETNTKM
jgi:hypothetical protein